MAIWDVSKVGSEVTDIAQGAPYGRTVEAIAIDSSGRHQLVVWGDQVNYVDRIYARVLEAHESTWEITQKDTAYLVTTGGGVPNCINLCKLSENLFVAYYMLRSGDDRIYARLLHVNTSTWAVTGIGPENLIFSGAHVSTAGIETVDGSHILCLYNESTNPFNHIRVALVNTDTGVISFVGTELIYGGIQSWGGAGCVKIDALGHWGVFIEVWNNPGEMRVLTIEANYNVIWAGVPFTTSVLYGYVHSLCKVDNARILQIVGDGNYLKFYVYNINLSTWEVTQQAVSSVHTGGCKEICYRSMEDDKHFQVLWDVSYADRRGFTQIMELDHTTWGVIGKGTKVDVKGSTKIYDFNISLIKPPSSEGHSLLLYYTTEGEFGCNLNGRVFEVSGPVTGYRNLYTEAQGVGGGYRFLFGEAKASKVSLKNFLCAVDRLAYGNFSVLNTEIKGRGYSVSNIKTDIWDVNYWRTGYKYLSTEIEGANVLFECLKSQIVAGAEHLEDIQTGIAARFILDTDIPFIRQEHYPADGQVAVSPYTTIIMKIVDIGAGVDLNTYWCKINGTTYNYGDAEVKAYSINPPNEYLFAVKPGFLGWNKAVNVSVYCEDRYGNPGLVREIL